MPAICKLTKFLTHTVGRNTTKSRPTSYRQLRPAFIPFGVSLFKRRPVKATCPNTTLPPTITMPVVHDPTIDAVADSVFLTARETLLKDVSPQHTVE